MPGGVDVRDRLSIEEYRDELLRLVTRITDVETVSLAGRTGGRWRRR